MTDSLSIAEAAAVADYSVPTVRYRIQMGYLNAFKDRRGQWRIPASEVRALIAREKYDRHPSA